MKITNTILSSPDNLKTALEIYNVIPEIKAKIMIKLFKELKTLFENAGRTTFDYSEDDVVGYYVSNRRIYPCLTVEIRKYSKNLSAALCIQVDDNLYYDFAFVEPDSQNERCEYKELKLIRSKKRTIYEAFSNAVVKVIKRSGKASAVSIFWDYIYDKNGKQYNFRQFSEPCAELVDTYKIQAHTIFETLDGYVEAIDKLL